MTTTVTNGAKAVFEVLRNWGVQYVFTCPGSTEAAFLDASFEYPDIALITVTHESIAVAMADGYARATGKPAVAYLHTNVGLTNGLSHLSAAHIAHSPVIILNGLKPTRIQNRGGFTTASSMRDFVRQYVKWDWQILRAEAIGEDVNRAFKIATSATPGPTYVGLSQDLLMGEAQIEVPAAARYQVTGRTRPDPDLIAKAAQLLVGAAHPLIIAGHEITQSNAHKEIIKLAEYLQAPVLTEERMTLESLDFPMQHPQYSGLYTSNLNAVQEADVILLAGARTIIQFNWSETPLLPTGTPLIHLYSNATDIAKIYPTDIPLVGNTALGLIDLQAALQDLEVHNLPERQMYMQRAQASYQAMIKQKIEDVKQQRETVPVRVPALMHELSQLLTPQTLLVAEPITSGVAMATHLLPYIKQSIYYTASGSLGWGMGAALSVKLANPDKEVLAVIGDGAFQFGIQALWTAVYYHIPVIFIIINNQSYAAVKAALYRYNKVAVKRHDFPATNLAGPKLAEIGRGFGTFGLRIEHLAELAPALQAAREKNLPAIIEVMTDTEDIGPL